MFQALHLPSESELMKADCAEWGLTKGEGRGGRAAKVCVRYHHKHARLHAALVRYRLLLNDPLVRYRPLPQTLNPACFKVFSIRAGADAAEAR